MKKKRDLILALLTFQRPFMMRCSIAIKPDKLHLTTTAYVEKDAVGRKGRQHPFLLEGKEQETEVIQAAASRTSSEIRVA